MKRFLLGILLVTTLLGTTLTAGCVATKIGDILDNFQNYEGKQVTIRGTVGETLWMALLEKGAFQVGDVTGNIWVITTQPPPEEGQKISVTGIVEAGYQLENRTLWKVITEIDRK
jgi:hypothetical protein